VVDRLDDSESSGQSTPVIGPEEVHLRKSGSSLQVSASPPKNWAWSFTTVYGSTASTNVHQLLAEAMAASSCVELLGLLAGLRGLVAGFVLSFCLGGHVR
jgi:hypothetical protein